MNTGSSDRRHGIQFQLIWPEPAARMRWLCLKEGQYLIIGHGGKINYRFLTGRTKATLRCLGEVVPLLRARCGNVKCNVVHTVMFIP